MTLPERLANLEPEKMRKIPVDKETILGFFIKASRSYDFASSAMSKFGSDYDNQIFTNFYDAIKFGFTSLLALYGYKTTAAGGHHINTFGFGSEILVEEISRITKDEELTDKIKDTHLRIERIIRDRQKTLYDSINEIISRTDLTALSQDIDFLLTQIKAVIEKSLKLTVRN